jgi:hypothetical protein
MNMYSKTSDEILSNRVLFILIFVVEFIFLLIVLSAKLLCIPAVEDNIYDPTHKEDNG